MSDKILFKHADNDKFEGYMPSKPDFFHDNYYVSKHEDNFHVPKGYAFRSRYRRGFAFGVQRKIHQSSSHGICIDGSEVGKSNL